MRVLKALRCTERRVMLFAMTVHQREAGPDGLDHLPKIVTLNVEAAAFERAIVGKGREDKMPAAFERTA